MSKDNTVEELSILIEQAYLNYFHACEMKEGKAPELLDVAQELVKSTLTTYGDQVEEEAWSASKLLWDRLSEWNKEWQEQNPGNELTMKDAMFLIEWKMEQVQREDREKINNLLKKANGTGMPEWTKGVLDSLQALTDKSV